MDLSKLSDSDLVALQSGDLSKVSDQGLAVLAQPKERTWGETGAGFAKTILPSLGGAVADVAHAITHPVQTGGALVDVMRGGLAKVIPESMQDPRQRQIIEQSKQAFESATGEMAKPYQNMASFKETLATDPARILADLSTVATGVGGAVRGGGNLAANAARAAGPVAPNLAQRIGETVSTVGRNIDPTVLALRGGAGAISGASSVGKKLAGLRSGVGEEALTQAYRAGQTGGERGATFRENMRGNAPITDVLDSAKADLAEMGRQKQRAYRSNMENVKNDKSILDFSGIDKSLADAEKYSSYKGQTINQAAADALSEIKTTVDDWKKLNPAEFHTPEGMDNLKQAIWDSMEKIPDNSKRAQTAAKEIYNSVKSEISKQAPEYSKAMKEYTDASETIQEIEKALSLGNKASADTSMRKLQSLMRNNANTNYGYRMNLAKELEQAGGHEMMPALAGQALNQWTPRGIQRAAAGPSALVAYGTGGLPLAAADLAVSSPRLMGEVAYKGGQLSRGLRQAGQKAQLPLNAANIDPRVLANYLYQINQQGQQ